MKDRIVIIGGDGYSKVIINTIKGLNNYEILGYTDKTNKGLLFGISYLGTDEVLSDIFKANKNCKAVISIGNTDTSVDRQEIYKLLKEIGFELPKIISKSAIVNEDVSIGEGTIIMEKAMINVCSDIGKCVIISSCAIVEHDCKVGNFVHMASGAIIGGDVKVDDNSIIGAGAKVIQGRRIGKNCVIGAGSVVINDILIEGNYFGIPAKRLDPFNSLIGATKEII